MGVILPWQQLVDPGIVVVIVPDPKQALNVELDGHPVLSGVHTGDLPYAHVGQVLHDPELVVKQLPHL